MKFGGGLPGAAGLAASHFACPGLIYLVPSGLLSLARFARACTNAECSRAGPKAVNMKQNGHPAVGSGTIVELVAQAKSSLFRAAPKISPYEILPNHPFL